MGFPAAGENLKIGKGNLFIAPWTGSTPPAAGILGKDCGNVTDFSISGSNTKLEKYSSTEAGAPLLDSRTLRQAYELTGTFDEHTLRNLALFLSGDETTVTQTVDTTNTYSIASALKGAAYYVGARGITSVVVAVGSTTKTLGTDYLLDAEGGIVKILESGTIANAAAVTITYGTPADTIDKVQIGLAPARTALVTFKADDTTGGNPSNDMWRFWKVVISSDGAMPLIGDDYSSFNLKMSVVSDAANHPTEPYGIVERVT